MIQHDMGSRQGAESHIRVWQQMHIDPVVHVSCGAGLPAGQVRRSAALPCWKYQARGRKQQVRQVQRPLLPAQNPCPRVPGLPQRQQGERGTHRLHLVPARHAAGPRREPETLPSRSDDGAYNKCWELAATVTCLFCCAAAQVTAHRQLPAGCRHCEGREWRLSVRRLHRLAARWPEVLQRNWRQKL
jgi:hypothetical protein